MPRNQRRGRGGGRGGQAHSRSRADANATGAPRRGRAHSNSDRRASPSSSRILNDAVMARVAADRDNSDDDEHMDSGDGRRTGAGAASTIAAAAAAEDSSSGSDFLSSQAEIREKRARREVQKAALASASASGSIHSSAAAAAASSAAAAAAASPAPRARLNLPGYVFDERRNKYFKLLPSHVHAAAAGRDADDAQDSDDEDDGDGDGRGERRAHQSHTSARFASLRVTGDPRLHAQSMHAHLSATSSSQQLSARIRAKKRPRSPVSSPADAAPIDPTLRALHAQAHGRNVLLNLHARQIGRPCPLAPALRLQSQLPALLRPLPLPLFRYASEPPESQLQLLLSGEHALSYEPHQRLLSVAGRRCWSGSSGGDGVVAQEAVSGSFYATFQLQPLGSFGSGRAHPDDEQTPGVAPPFRLRQVAVEHTDSPVTSMHRFASWEMRFPPADSASSSASASAHPAPASGRGPRSNARAGGSINSAWGLGNAFTEERRLRASAARLARSRGAHNVWSEEESINAESDPISNVLALTKLGGQEPGSFELCSAGDAEGGEHGRARRVYKYRVAVGSVWTSAFPRSMAQAALLPASAPCKVALGCTKGGLVLDLVADRRVYTCHSGKSDVLAQCWVKRGGGDDVCLLSGSRDGVVRMDDTRQPSRHSAAAAAAAAGSSALSLRLSSSVCFLQQLQSNENHLLAAAVDGQMCLYDLRRCSPAPMAAAASSSSSSSRGGGSRPSPASSSASVTQPARTAPLLCFSGHANSFTPIRPFVHESATSSGEQWLFCGGEDGRARAWNLRESQPILDAEPLRTPPLQRRIAWKHAAYIDEFRTLLCASELGVAALTLSARA